MNGVQEKGTMSRGGVGSSSLKEARTDWSEKGRTRPAEGDFHQKGRNNFLIVRTWMTPKGGKNGAIWGRKTLGDVEWHKILAQRGKSSRESSSLHIRTTKV